MALKTDNLQIYYPFANSSCYPGTGTTVTNLGLAGSTYNGTVTANAIRASAPGNTAGTIPTYDSVQNGGVFKFYGNKGRITIPDGSVTRIGSGIWRTIQMWVKWDSLTAPLGNGLTSATIAPIFGKLSNNTGFDGYIGYATNTGALRLTLNAAAEYIPSTGAGFITTTPWYFITMNINTANATNNIRFYKNGTREYPDPTKYGATWVSTETNPLQLGTGFMNYSTSTYGGVTAGAMESFSGLIGDFMMYDVNLTDAEVLENFNSTKGKYGFVDPGVTKYYDGTTWQTATGRKVWNGSSWIDWTASKWNGTSWVSF